MRATAWRLALAALGSLLGCSAPPRADTPWDFQPDEPGQERAAREHAKRAPWPALPHPPGFRPIGELSWPDGRPRRPREIDAAAADEGGDDWMPIERRPDGQMVRFLLFRDVTRDGEPIPLESLLQAGRQYLAAGEDEGYLAHWCFDRALERDPGCLEAWLGRARARLQSYPVEPGSVDDWEQALLLDPANEEALSGVHAHAAPERARRALDALVSLRPIAWLEQRSQERVERGRLTEAMLDLDRLLRLLADVPDSLPDQARLHARRGRIAAREGRLDDAIRDLSRALELEPTGARLLARGTAHWLKGDLPAAREDLTAACGNGSFEQSEARLRLALLELDRGQALAAAGLLADDVATHDPGARDVIRGVADLMQGRDDQTRIEWARALSPGAVVPDHKPEVNAWRIGRFLAASPDPRWRDPDRARTFLVEGNLARNVMDMDTLALLRAAQGEWDEAVRFGTKAVDHVPPSFPAARSMYAARLEGYRARRLPQLTLRDLFLDPLELWADPYRE